MMNAQKIGAKVCKTIHRSKLNEPVLAGLSIEQVRHIKQAGTTSIN
jgi:hypothetical protein